MLDATQPHDPQYLAFQQSRRDKEWSTRCLLASFAYLGIPSSLFDVGCGDGHLVRLSRSLGVDAYGIDLHGSNGPWVILHDLKGGSFEKPSSMVLCWELAEHLPEHRADELCFMLSASTIDYLLFSAAIPGQGGSGHLNEQPHEYWTDKLTSRGLAYVTSLTDELRRVFSEVAPACPWYGHNLIVFEKT